MSEPYRLTDRALNDLNSIWDYIADDNPLAADGFISRLLRTCMLLAQSPRMGRARDELGKEYRSHPVGNYLIFYRELPGAIEILRIVHGSRDLKKIFEPFEK
jgi:toxin ParE1/3/4